jgi:hypothetical protein
MFSAKYPSRYVRAPILAVVASRRPVDQVFGGALYSPVLDMRALRKCIEKEQQEADFRRNSEHVWCIS